MWRRITIRLASGVVSSFVFLLAFSCFYGALFGTLFATLTNSSMSSTSQRFSNVRGHPSAHAAHVCAASPRPKRRRPSDQVESTGASSPRPKGRRLSDQVEITGASSPTLWISLRCDASLRCLAQALADQYQWLRHGGCTSTVARIQSAIAAMLRHTGRDRGSSASLRCLRARANRALVR